MTPARPLCPGRRGAEARRNRPNERALTRGFDPSRAGRSTLNLMDAPLRAAARALATFDPLAALKSVALRDDPDALALRGVALAQLGDFEVARKLLARAARAFGDRAPAARARCVVAEAEVALASRDLVAAGRALDAAVRVLDASGDLENARFARLQGVRRWLLLGQLRDADAALAALDFEGASARIVASAELLRADIAMRSLHARDARAALERAFAAARRAGLPPLLAEVTRAARGLEAPAARLLRAGKLAPITLASAEAVLASSDLVVNACQREICLCQDRVRLLTRPVLFALAQTLAESLPGAASREALIQRAFGAAKSNESLRARLRVELGRLRRLLRGLAELRATEGGFLLVPRARAKVSVLLPPTDEATSALFALLSSGESWSTSGLAAALGCSQRAVQRALAALQSDGRVEATGRGRSRRWVARPSSDFATTMLLVAAHPQV